MLLLAPYGRSAAIMHNLFLFGEHKMQGVILILESININLV